MATLTPDPAVSQTVGETDNALPIPSPNDLPDGGTAASSDNSVASNAPGTTEQTNIPIQVHKRGDGLVKRNVLDDYINVTYHINLGMVSKEAIERLQTNTVQRADLTADDYIIFASTGDVDTNSPVTIDYYNIRSFSFTSFMGHVQQNPIVAAIWDGKMKILEPYGFNLREDIEQMSKAKGYDGNVSPSNFVYRLEIWFSGWEVTDSSGRPSGRHIEKIEIPIHESRSEKTIVYYLSITTVEARVTAIGTEYDLSFQTFSHLATRAETIMLRKDSVGTGGQQSSSGQSAGSSSGSVNVSAPKDSTFRNFLESLSKSLHTQVEKDTQGKVDATYEFVGLKGLFDATFVQGIETDVATGVSLNPQTGATVVAGKDVDLYTLISHVMDSLKLVRDLRLRPDDPNFTQPTVEWNIRTNIKERVNADNQINNFKKWTFQYIIEPVLTFRCRTSQVPVRNRQADYANQAARAKAMAGLGMITRIYDYIFTNDNSEIIDFQLRYKYFYYVPYPYSGPEVTMHGLGAHSDDENATNRIANLKTSNFGIDAADTTKPTFTFTVPDGDIGSLFGIQVPSEGATTQYEYRNIFGGFNRGPHMPPTQGKSDADNRAQQMNLIARDQYLRYDMLDAQMTVRMDPVWLMNPYMSGQDFTPEVQTDSQEKGVFCYAHVDRAVLIRAYRPNQRSFMNPDVSTFSARSAPILGGFYQVITVVNRFDAGKMTQDLNMIKYDHLNYFFETLFSSTGQQNTSQSPDPGV